MSLTDSCTKILDLKYERENLSDEAFQTFDEIQRRVDSLVHVDTPAVLQEISSLKLLVRKQIANLQSLDNELELAKRSLVEQMSTDGNSTMQIEILHNAAMGRPNDSVYQFIISDGNLNWEIKN
jgi:hypothetical protein